VTASHDELRAIAERLDERPTDYEVLFLAERDGSKRLLTDRQAEVLETAFRAGYFEVPRAVSLTELAEHLDADPSTIGGVIRRAQQRVLDDDLSDPVLRIEDG
jgi:predicted DNA binding protein